MRLIKLNPILSIVNGMLGTYPNPATMTYFWNFGSLAGICLVVQIITGIFLAMNYVPNVDLAFSSVEHIMRDVNYGWLLRYIHSNGASMFFIVVYVHIFRGIYYGSYNYPRQLPWSIGVTIYLLMMATGFLGYVLPWGQMSFWGATVITNFFSAVPVLGEDIVHLLWGGFSVNNATLNRFFSLHYLLPFLIAALSGLHIAVLHINRSNNPIGVPSNNDTLPFHPYYTVKDVFGLLFFFFLFALVVFFFPNYLGHPDNYTVANPMVTPAHIVPEWYYLPFYAILRSIPDKLGGVVAMFGSIAVLYLVPMLNTSKIRSSWFRPMFRPFFWLFVVCGLVLGWVGGCTPEAPFVQIGQVMTIYYFSFFFLIIPFVGYLENKFNLSNMSSL